MSTPEKYFINHLRSHHCQLPPSDDFEYMKQVKKFKNFFLISEKSLQSYLKAKCMAAIYYEKRRQLRTTQILVVHPFSEFCRFWQLLMCFVLLTCVILYPFSTAFNGPFDCQLRVARHSSFITFYFFVIFVFIIQMFCILDILVNFITGYVNQSTDEMVIQPTGIARHYLYTYFLVDLISSLPFGFFIVMLWGTHGYCSLLWSHSYVVLLLPLLKLIRLRTLYEYFHNIFGCFSSSYTIYNMVSAVSLYFLIIHWGGCLNVGIPHFVLGDGLIYRDGPPYNTSWLRTTRVIEKHMFGQYFASIYLCLNYLTGIGLNLQNVRNTEDKVLAIVLGIVGRLYWLLLLIVFLQMLSTMRTGNVRYKEMMDQVKEYMEHKKFPRELRRKIQLYYVYMFQKEYVGEESILRLLSDNLRQEIMLTMHQRLIEKIHLFSSLSQTLVYSILSRLKPEIYLTNDVVYKVRDVGDCMFFVSFGTVAIYSESGREIGHVDDGDYFGEISLILDTKRTATVVALETTEVYRLSVQDFVEIIKPHSTQFLKMEKIAVDRYRKTHDKGDWKEEGEKNSAKKNLNEEDEDEDDDYDDEEAEDSHSP